ncbi:MAG: ABC transporter substrate-binding protein [Deltaproteobacteria bacterium]|nr:ABC transporter substrate-binding protein [Deltaproteobacteria bacterium]
MGQALAASRLLVPYPAVAGAFAPFFIAKELGLFSRHDLQVDLVFVSGAGKATMLLVGGTSPLVVTSGTATIGANLVGADLIIVAGNP